jgi:hypothetical protein
LFYGYETLDDKSSYLHNLMKMLFRLLILFCTATASAQQINDLPETKTTSVTISIDDVELTGKDIRIKYDKFDVALSKSLSTQTDRQMSGKHFPRASKAMVTAVKVVVFVALIVLSISLMKRIR